ncbi:MAG: cytochrome b, partial [Rhodospirillales bacterium]|nr:cytochrome b [Rhodospirillales bacterium]
KLIGVVLMFGSILILLFLPWLDRSPVRSARFRPLYRQFFWLFLINCLILGAAGKNPPEGHWIWIGQLATAYYFAHFLIIIPLLSYLERPRQLPSSISAAVTPGGIGIPARGAAE